MTIWIAPEKLDERDRRLHLDVAAAPGAAARSRPGKHRLHGQAHDRARALFARSRAESGVSVAVKLPDGRELTEREVVVEDLFIVALGDSFASGESNPDRPVQFSA